MKLKCPNCGGPVRKIDNARNDTHGDDDLYSCDKCIKLFVKIQLKKGKKCLISPRQDSKIV